MEPPMTFPHPRFTRRTTGRKGVALLTVLATLALLTVIVMAILTNAGTELKSSKVYAAGVSVKLLSQSAVNLVQAEINDATHNGNLCWTSQPGMIRTFDINGQPVKHYKLYSDRVMVENGAYDAAAGAPPADWYDRTATYVDLNQPESVNGVFHYPIVEGDATRLVDYTPSTTVGTVKALGPINTGINVPQVAGFWIQQNGAQKAPLQPGTANQAPMPVRWLYVLRDGSLISPDADSGATATFTSLPAGKRPDNKDKEIVGRIAFWTDDESSKVNVNTASEGAYLDSKGVLQPLAWDVPRFRLGGDVGFNSKSQPVQNEFQRYPGHPATVSLSAVFGNLLTDGPSQNGGLTYPENVYALTPRTISGGSLHGTVQVTGLTAPLPLKTDRLYPTVDEFMFRKNRAFNATLLSGDAALDQVKVEQAKFFLTATSRSPDVSVFNRPRISMWPVSALGDRLPFRSPKDQLIAFCTTVNGLPYYFQRQDANDPSTDLPVTGGPAGLPRNRELLEYLRHLTGRQIPGFGGSLATKYSAGDTQAGSGIPASTREVDQILTQQFDYIRSTNMRDQSMATATNNPVTTYTSTLVTAPATMPFGHVMSGGSGQVVPIFDSVTGTRGFGRFPTLQQAGLIFYANKDNGLPDPNKRASQMRAFFVLQFADPSMGYPWSSPCYRIRVTGLTGFQWEAGNAATQMFAADPEFLPNPNTTGFNNNPTTGGIVSWRRLLFNAQASDDPNFKASNPNYSALFSTPYPSAAANPGNLSYTNSPSGTPAPVGLGISNIRFKGGPVKVEIYKNLPGNNGGTPDPSTLLQSITLTIPDAPAAGFPVPTLSAPGTVKPATMPSHIPGWQHWSNRWRSTSENDNFGAITSTRDVMRTVIANPGDTRLVAARKTIDDTAMTTFFRQHPLYASTNEMMAHCLQNTCGQTEWRGSMTATKTGGMLVALKGPYYDGYSNTGYYSVFGKNFGLEYEGMGTAPFWSDVPTNQGVFVGGSGTIPGDWDNGLPFMKDGPYLNKPDEGDIYTTTDSPYFEKSYGAKSLGQTFFSPNRMVPSPGMMGSLPTGVLANKPWQTLLFRPGPAGHPGLGTSVTGPGDAGPPYVTPPDHLFMDLFTMPVVEPYAISEPLSTAGRVNMNYQIVPFTYINRSTAMEAVLRGTQVIAVPDSDANIYKYETWYATSPTPSRPYRTGVDAQATLSQFRARFDRNDVFRSASEICNVDIVPVGYTGALPPTRASMDTFWSTRRITGDNSRERPYTTLYPLLTTKSNTYTVHFRVQTLKKVNRPDAEFAEWKEGTDVVTGEYRGSQTIERYVDPNDATDENGNGLPNFADPANYDKTLAPYYKFRVISSRQFAP
ncbi:hypothetical protein DB346_01570 [Verrucomicrobia bacterium LW23]|nr:hypothetical protein DB346_01570 [Verrucomicrobia bacterium LW23]